MDQFVVVITARLHWSKPNDAAHNRSRHHNYDANSIV